MEKMLYDIEIYQNFFCVGIKNYDTKEIIFYEISEEKDDRKAIYDFFMTFTGFLISFNGIHYDNMIIKYYLKNYEDYEYLHWINITSDLKWFSNKIIDNSTNDNEINKIKYLKTGWIDIDLFLYWSRGIRISKKISLKALGVQLGYPVIQELPYKHDAILKREELPVLRYYNYTHDLGILEMLTDAQQPEILLRHNIVKDYNLDCWSWDAPKIASEALLTEYCKTTNKITHEVRKYHYTKPDFYLRDVLVGFDPAFKLKLFQDLFEDIKKSKNSYSRDFLVTQGNTNIILTFGNGGLHSINENEQYYSNDTHKVMTSDVESLYPNFIINFKCIRFLEVLNQYIDIKVERIIAKKNKEKVKDKFFKLILNGISGLIDMEYSWLYFPEGAMRLRLIGQLTLTKLIETCILNEWQVVSANTDGIEVIVPVEDLEKYENVLDETIKLFNAKLEHEQYDKIIYKNVNNYLAVTKKGKVKRKGFFKLAFDEEGNREIPLGDSCDELIISKALNAFYTKNISPKEFITSPDKYDINIYDYCKSNKISKDFTVYHNGQKQQNLNRYYFCKTAPYLFKRKHDVGTFQHVNVNEGVKIFNTYEKKLWDEYKINYQYYITKTQKIIDEINHYNQLSLF